MDYAGKRLRLLIPDLLGLERGKYLFGEVAQAGHAAFCIGLYPLTLDREILPVPRQQFDIGLPDIEAELDRDTVRRGWEDETVVGIGDVFQHGQPFEVDPRQVLRTAVRAWREMELEPQLAFETEFYLCERSDDGAWVPVDLPSHRVYGTGMSVDPSGAIHDMVGAALGCGFQVESWCSEFDAAAFEVNWRYRDAIPAADDAFLFRILVREIAARHGRLATFLGRPFNDRGGSGMHLNVSFRRPDGSNAFHDPSRPDGMSALAERCIAGILAHHRGTAAFMAPHVNAYKRLKPDMLNGYLANWGYDDRTVTVRVPPARGEGSRLEHRTADAAANPYLAAAALLHAARLGVEEQLELGPAQEPGADPNTDVAVPDTLEEALEELQADTKIVGAMGEWVAESFVTLKRAEWDRYVAAGETSVTDVTPWEIEYYLPFF
ncbi:MAG TPA: glutamine synthetase family protein [Actinomycetota bacterium]|nr:glutamine synthetase family protein [Actinomycetota bacterium]